MDMRRLKAVLFIVVFLLVMAVAVNLLVDMQNTREEVNVSNNAPSIVTPPVEMTLDPVQVQTPLPAPQLLLLLWPLPNLPMCWWPLLLPLRNLHLHLHLHLCLRQRPSLWVKLLPAARSAPTPVYP